MLGQHFQVHVPFRGLLLGHIGFLTRYAGARQSYLVW